MANASASDAGKGNTLMTLSLLTIADPQTRVAHTVPQPAQPYPSALQGVKRAVAARIASQQLDAGVIYG